MCKVYNADIDIWHASGKGSREKDTMRKREHGRKNVRKYTVGMYDSFKLNLLFCKKEHILVKR